MGYSSCSIKAGHQIWSFFQHFWFILLYIPCLPLRLKCQSTHLFNPEHVFQIQRSSSSIPKSRTKLSRLVPTKTKRSSLEETLAVSSRRTSQPIRLPKSNLSRVWLQTCTCTLPRMTSIAVFFLFYPSQFNCKQSFFSSSDYKNVRKRCFSKEPLTEWVIEEAKMVLMASMWRTF